MWGRILAIGLAALAWGAAHGAPKARGLAFGPAPEWVVAVPLPQEKKASQDDGNGIDELLIDRQIDAAGEALYARSARRFVNASGVERGSQLQFRWDPSYQTLTLHDVSLLRGGERINALRPEAVEILRRETGMEYGLFDGSLTAALVIHDVRPGDTLDYAYTLTGYNPIFAGKYLDDFGMRADVPIGHLRFRLLWPRERRLFRKPHGDVPTPSMKAAGGVVELVWDVQPAAPLLIESDLPSWYDPYPWLQLSEFETWRDVARWAVPLYERGKPRREVRALAQKFAAEGKSDAERVAAALKFVQEEIRYLGLEMGTGSHRPNPPEVVLSRRFGDCKDKTMLLLAILDELGVKAWPALVHTDRASKVSEWHPSPLAFNHVIVLATVKGGSPWLDPTQTRQGEGLADAPPPYYRALVVDPTTTSLTEMTPPRRSETLVHEEWEVPSLDAPASLTVKTKYRGPRANAMRASFANQHRDAMEKAMTEFYTERYPGISSAKPIEIDDDLVANVVTLTESYTVADFFASKDKIGLKASVYPQEIRDAIPDPGSRKRTMPLGLAYPVVVGHEAVIHLPEDWEVTPTKQKVETPYFRYQELAEAKGQVVRFVHSWETLADSIPADKVPGALAELATITDSLGWELTHKGVVQAETKATGLANLNFTLAAVSVLFLGLCTGAAVKAARWQPAPPAGEVAVDPKLVGLRGWLILLGFGLVVSPFRLIAGMGAFADAFRADTWATLTTPGGDAFHPAWAPVIIGEVLFNLLIFVMVVLLPVLFFRRKRSFPKVMIAMLVFSVVGLILDALVLNVLPVQDAKESSDAWVQVGRAVIPALIWIPYLLRSKRVRATFVR